MYFRGERLYEECSRPEICLIQGRQSFKTLQLTLGTSMGSHTSLKTSVNVSPDIGPDKSVSCARNCIRWQMVLVNTV